jgi:hypothetical protein
MLTLPPNAEISTANGVADCDDLSAVLAELGLSHIQVLLSISLHMVR